MITVISHGQHVGGGNLTLDTRGANFIFGTLSCDGADDLHDGPGGTYVKHLVGTSYGRLMIWHCANPTVSASHTFASSATNPSFCVMAVSGVDTASPFDKESTEGTGTSTCQPGTAITPAQDNSIVIAAVGGDQHASISVDGGFTIAENIFGVSAVNYGNGLAYLIQTAAASARPTFTSSGFSMIALSAAFKAAIDPVAIRLPMNSLRPGIFKPGIAR